MAAASNAVTLPRVFLSWVLGTFSTWLPSVCKRWKDTAVPWRHFVVDGWNLLARCCARVANLQNVHSVTVLPRHSVFLEFRPFHTLSSLRSLTLWGVNLCDGNLDHFTTLEKAGATRLSRACRNWGPSALGRLTELDIANLRVFHRKSLVALLGMTPALPMQLTLPRRTSGLRFFACKLPLPVGHSTRQQRAKSEPPMISCPVSREAARPVVRQRRLSVHLN